MKRFHEEVFETADLELRQFALYFENENKTLNDVMNQIVLSKTLHLSASADQPFHYRELISFLGGFRATHSFIDEIIVLFNDNDYVVLSSSTAQKDYFFHKLFVTENYTPESLEKCFTESPSSFILPAQRIHNRSKESHHRQCLVFGFPILTDSRNRLGTIIFTVKSEHLRSNLSYRLRSYGTVVYLQNENRDILFATSDNGLGRQLLEKNKFETLPSMTNTENCDCFIRTYDNEQSGRRYVAFIPDKPETFGQVNTLTQEYFWLIAITLIICFLLILLLQKYNYAPLKQLFNKASTVSPEADSPNEFRTISAAFDYLSDQKNSLEGKLESNRAAVKTNVLIRLLTNRYPSREEFNFDNAELGLTLPYSYLFVSVLHLESIENNREEAAEKLRNEFNREILSYYLLTLDPQIIVFIHNTPQRPSDCKALLTPGYSRFCVAGQPEPTLGIGTAVCRCDKLASSYLEAMHALNYRFIEGSGIIISFNNIKPALDSTATYPYKAFEKLHSALLSRNTQFILESIDEIISIIADENMALFLARTICSDLVTVVERQYQSTDFGSINLPYTLMNISSKQGIVKILKSWQKQLNFNAEQAEQSLDINKVCKYINEHCSDPNFSVYETAEHFNMSLSNFSKNFKSQTGQNPTDYVTHERMQKASELLINTELPLKDIAEQVGYYSVSSFVRRFKLEHGITPNVFRNLHMADSSEAK